MGKLKTRLADLQVPEYQNIQIERTRPVAIACGAVAAKLQFNAEQAFEQGMRVKISLKHDHRVEKMRLIGETDGLGGIQRRARRDASERLEAQTRGGQRGLGWPCSAGTVCAHSDVRGLHVFSEYLCYAFRWPGWIVCTLV